MAFVDEIFMSHRGPWPSSRVTPPSGGRCGADYWRSPRTPAIAPSHLCHGSDSCASHSLVAGWQSALRCPLASDSRAGSAVYVPTPCVPLTLCPPLEWGYLLDTCGFELLLGVGGVHSTIGGHQARWLSKH